MIDKNAADVGDDDAVIKLIGVGKLQAAQLVPILRPMLPQYAHLAADVQTNSLLIVARYANVKTIESLIRELEKKPVATTGREGSDRPSGG